MITLLEPNTASITPWSLLESIGSKIAGMNVSMTGAASAVWPSANLAVYVPFVLRRQITVTQLFWYNGATASGNVDVGIYTADGARIVSSGSTAQGTINVLQAVDITDTPIGPGLYRMALAVNNGTATMFAAASGLIALFSSAGVTQQATAFALPATSTIATATFDYLPVFGLTTGGVL